MSAASKTHGHRRRTRQDAEAERALIVTQIDQLLKEWTAEHAALFDASWVIGVVYARISKDRVGKGVSVIDQVKDCLALAVTKKVRVIAVRFDNDLSAYKKYDENNEPVYSKPRPDYDRLLQELRERAYWAVLVWHTDRLHRDPIELGTYINVCGAEDDGVDTYTVKSGEIHLDTSAGRLNARIQADVAKHFIEHMIEQLKAAQKRARETGQWSGGPRPFGYQPRPSPRNHGDGGMDRIDAEFAGIADVIAVVLQLGDGTGVWTGCRMLNEARLFTPEAGNRGGGNFWEPSALRRMLQSPTIAGRIAITYTQRKAKNGGHTDPLAEARAEAGPDDIIRVSDDGRTVTRYRKALWEPATDFGTWERVTAILGDPKRTTSPGPKPAWLLTSVLICDVCGGTTFAVHPALAELPAGADRKKKRPGRKAAYVCISLAHTPDALLPPCPDCSGTGQSVPPLGATAEAVAAALAASGGAVTVGALTAATGLHDMAVRRALTALADRGMAERGGGLPQYTWTAATPAPGEHAQPCRRCDGNGKMKRFHLTREQERLDDRAAAEIRARLAAADEASAAVQEGRENALNDLYEQRDALNRRLRKIAALKITDEQVEIRSREPQAELERVRRQITEAEQASPLDGREPGETRVAYWDRLVKAGRITELRAIAATVIRVRLRPVGKVAHAPGWKPGQRNPFPDESVEFEAAA
jgi:DNA invertase Pin-like site-specific DNA recombinase